MPSEKLSDRLPAIIITLTLVAGTMFFISRLDPGGGDGGLVEVVVPTLSAEAERGRDLFDANCTQCHGANAAGGQGGPPLVHKIYNPGHHADGAFYAAAKLGATQHHWRFGNMPAQPHLSDDKIAAIVRFVRELQRANGI